MADALRPGGRHATVLVRAAERATGRVLELLLRYGASANALDDSETAVDGALGYTALHAAAWNNNIEAIRVLLAHGADVRRSEQTYCSPPAGWANYAGHTAARDLILEGDVDPFQAIDFVRPDRLRAVIERDPSLRYRPFSSYADCPPREDQWWPSPEDTPLSWAVKKKKDDAVAVLRELGVS